MFQKKQAQSSDELVDSLQNQINQDQLANDQLLLQLDHFKDYKLNLDCRILK